MNKNIENYKKAVDQIHVDSDLKQKVLEQAKEKQNEKKTVYYLRYVVSIAAVLIVAIVGVSFANKEKKEILNINKSPKEIKQEETELLSNINVRRFESIDELRDVLKANEQQYTDTRKGDYFSIDALTETNTAQEEKTYGTSDYSRTNNQVENVDEADIVKTDGKYIYYVQNNQVYIIDKDLNLKSTIEDNNFYVKQIFVNGTKLVAFGNNYSYNTIYDVNEEYTDSMKERVSMIYRAQSGVRVYDLDNINSPKLSREITIDGDYQNARMIEDNVYLISNYYQNLYGIDQLKDDEILPRYNDSIQKGINYIDATDIAYFKDTESYSFTLIAGFNLNSNSKVNVETLFGAGTEIYVSENNLYLVASNGYWRASESTIYKFKLEDSKVFSVTSAKVKGYVGNQFAIDEYEGNLRVATTSYEDEYTGLWFYKDYSPSYSTHLTIFNKDLEKIGEIENLIKDEEIYAVRFIGKVGYIVTFQEVDPLWVIDLSDPTNPQVKGELEIPGYSSYLHPYDENHIIGIGYNVKDNGYGGVANDTLKISMFDVSDVSNPKEIFNNTFNVKNASSSIIYEHKALFFNKEENLIGFPVESWSRTNDKSGLLLYRIDMKNKKFEEIDDLVENVIYNTMQRAIYIGDKIYTIYLDKIICYDMKTFDKINTLELEY